MRLAQCGMHCRQYLACSLSSEETAPPSSLNRPYPITLALAISTGDRFSTHAGVAPLPLGNGRLSDPFAVEKSTYSRRLTTVVGQLQSLVVREWLWTTPENAVHEQLCIVRFLAREIGICAPHVLYRWRRRLAFDLSSSSHSSTSTPA
jgi:hypothetical protein